jgi:chloramphenicol O-acetyltransferase type B
VKIWLSRLKDGLRFAIPRRPILDGVNIIGGGKPEVHIGISTYINSANLYCWKSNLSLRIGSYCSLAEGINFILGGEHDVGWASTYPFIERWKLSELSYKCSKKSRGDIEVQSDVWIGHGVTILSGVTIGVGSVIGAGSLVRESIPPFSIAGGIPARVIKQRFSDDICAGLLATKWWTLEKDELIRFVKYMDQPEVFICEIMRYRNRECFQ